MKRPRWALGPLFVLLLLPLSTDASSRVDRLSLCVLDLIGETTETGTGPRNNPLRLASTRKLAILFAPNKSAPARLSGRMLETLIRQGTTFGSETGPGP